MNDDDESENTADDAQQADPPAIEGHHAGRKVDDPLRETLDGDSGVGAVSRPAGNSMAGEDDDTEGIFDSDDDSTRQSSDYTPHSGRTTHHVGGHERHTEGAFGNEAPTGNAKALDDYSDKAIEKRELGSSDN